MDSTVESQTDTSQSLLGCPMQEKLGSNACYCDRPWTEEVMSTRKTYRMRLNFRQLSAAKRKNKRRIQVLRRHIKKSFTQDDCDEYLLHLIPWSSAISACPHGNYMLQEVMARASISALQIFISSCPMTNIMEDEFGSRVVENLLEMHSGLFVPLIFNRVSHLFNRLARNPRANYCIQKLCELMPLENYGAVMRVAIPFAARLSMHQHGAYVIQAILNRLLLVADHGFLFDDGANPPVRIDIDQNKPSYAMLEEFLYEFIAAGPKMIQHAVGNFTVQALVNVLHLCPWVEQQFVNGICERIVMYIACKFGTRVVERVLECGSYWAKDQIVNRMMQLNESEFSFFMRTRSAQYLYRKVLSCADEGQKQVFDEMTCYALAESANPYAVGMLIEDTSPPLSPVRTMGNSSYVSSSCSSGDETVEVPFDIGWSPERL